MPSVDKPQLVLGWQTTPTLEPAYWLEGTASPGLQTLPDLVRVPADSIACHTAIIAQSGSGKSLFLGRLVEEIIIRTKARCLILDPNADFRRAHEVEDSVLWGAARYDTRKRRGKLPHEKNRSEFAALWRPDNIRIRTGNPRPQATPYERLQVSWPSLSMDVLAEDIDPMLRTDLYHCHTFVKELAELHEYKDATPIMTAGLIDEAELLLRQARTMPEGALRSTLEVKYNAKEMLSAPSKGTSPPYMRSMFVGAQNIKLPRGARESLKMWASSRITSLIENLARAPQYVSQSVEHFYFSKARSYIMSGVITLEVERVRASLRGTAKRLEVVDLPSLKDQPTRLLAVNAIMTAEWNYARARWDAALRQEAVRDTRVPTFIVIDEAHNLIPADPRTKAESALREIFRTIVAEGRKYGLFVILVSQRPDKLDSLVLSECDNKAIMRLSSGSVLTMTRGLLGLDDVHPKMLERCLECDPGRALLVGRWAPSGPQFMYCAARRTVEGGRNLREEYWASPADHHPAAGATRAIRRVVTRRRLRRRSTKRQTT